MASTNRTSALNYVAPSYDVVSRLSERRSSQFDGIIVPGGPRIFKAKQGNNTIRILPPTWKDPIHYSYEVKIHNEVGPNRGSYICLNENEAAPTRDCPLCEERNSSSLSTEEKDKLRPRARNYLYLIDRKETNVGVQLWSISTQADKEILTQSLIKRTQRYLPIVHPIDGYDIDFSREGEMLNTRYRGYMVSRESTPLSTNEDEMMEWIKYIDNHPIPEILQFYSADHIREVYHGRREAPRDQGVSSRDRDNPRTEEQPDPRRRLSPEDDRPAGNGHDDTRSDPVRDRLRARLEERENQR